MAYTLDSLHRKQMLASLHLVIDFSKFDKNFSCVLTRLMYHSEKKHKNLLRNGLHHWYSCVLNPTKVLKISNNVSKYIIQETEQIQKSNKEWTTLRSEYRQEQIRQQAKVHLEKVFNKLMTKDTKRCFD